MNILVFFDWCVSIPIFTIIYKTLSYFHWEIPKVIQANPSIVFIIYEIFLSFAVWEIPLFC